MPGPRPWPRGAMGKAAAWAALACAAMAARSLQKGEKEPATQTLQYPPALPATAAGATARLVFCVTPLSAHGLLSQQTRDALRALNRAAGGVVLHIRAFVAGTGDIRRVRDLVSETFTSRAQPLPALSLVKVGALPLTGAQVLLEAVAEGKKEVNPNGLAFLSAQAATAGDPLGPVAPLAGQAVASLGRELAAAGAAPSDVVRVTCFFSSLDELAALRGLISSAYPHAAASYIQPRRSPGEALAACEAVARLRRPPGAGLQLLDAADAPREPGASAAALVGAPEAVFTGTQESFGYEERDARLALERLENALAKSGAAPGDIACARWYALAPNLASQARNLRLVSFDPAHPPAGSVLLFEGLPSMDAGLAWDAVAVKD